MKAPQSKLLAIPAIACTVLLLLAPGARAIHGASPQASQPQAPTPQPSQRKAATPEREDALKGFNERVSKYIDMRKTLQEGVPAAKPGDRATGAAEAKQDTIAVRIQQARKTAKAGDIFGDAAPYFTRIIKHDTETRGVRDAYAAMQEVPSKSPLAVNTPYPEKAALATVPPLILVNLPRLPDGLEYRFMGRDLILRDREANLIVDLLPGAVPVLKP